MPGAAMPGAAMAGAVMATDDAVTPGTTMVPSDAMVPAAAAVDQTSLTRHPAPPQRIGQWGRMDTLFNPDPVPDESTSYCPPALYRKRK